MTDRIANDITELIGNTPLVRIRNLLPNADFRGQVCSLIGASFVQ